ncbi:hypothetical protein CCR75_005172 [Bremia lactucae]|uniref:CSC1/OSCA1-like 7TM region domain-containing protein n=1 Tax=Bremia lactucae TaxID=4779 RepID=A0A976FLQ6_BRELC|nr:hypothetical protein CCR75_005172 [Bremia lactucae]
MSTTQQDAAMANANPSGTIRTSASIYFPILATGVFLFECIRRRFHHAYESCPQEEDLLDMTTSKSCCNGLFCWIYANYRVSDDDIFQRYGLDTLTFLRFLKLGQKLALVGVGCSVVLFPLYATAEHQLNMQASIDPLTRISMSNLPERSVRLWAPTVVAIVMSTYAMRLLIIEYKLYVCYRHEVLGRMEAPQYSVLINDLPLHLRTHQTLEKYMSKIFPSSIRNVYVALECATLETLVDRREKARNRLEHALAKSEHSRTRPQYQQRRSWARMLICLRGRRYDEGDIINRCQEELRILNEEVVREIQSIEDAQARLAALVEEKERELSTFDDGEELRMSVSEAYPFAKENTGLKEALLIDRRGWADLLHYTFVGDDDFAFDEENASRHEQKMSQDEREQVRQKRPIRMMRRAAFVSFTSLSSAQVAQQALQSEDPKCLVVVPAPHEDDINWGNIGRRYRTRTLGMLLSYLLSATIVLFWTIPTAFIASLATVESLRRALPLLNNAIDNYPMLQEIFEQIAPLALVLLSALAPIVFNFLSGREGHPSKTEVRASLFTKLAYFQLVQIFFVTVIVGTILDSLKEILDQPKKLVAMLGRSMPQQSTFFISYVIVQTGLGLTMELLRIVPLILSILFALLAPNRTQREHNMSWFGLRDISQTNSLDPTNILADCFLVLLLTLTFAPIAPLVCYFTCFFFVVAEIVYRRQIVCVYKPMRFALGAYWPRLYNFCIIALVVAQLTLIGILSLKKAAIPSIIIIVLVIIVLIFNYQVLSLYPHVAKYLPLTQCIRLDSARGDHDATAPEYFFLDNVYRQPVLNQRPAIVANYRMLENDYSDDLRQSVV